jgi:Stage II sporulation protein E (SpoIIE)
MRPSPRHRLTGIALALSLCSALMLPFAAVASASLLGEALPAVSVKAGSLVTVETAPSPKIEVPGVATVQLPAPQVEAPSLPVTKPSLPPVTTPSAPPVTVPSLPSSGTPVAKTPSVPTSLGEAGAGGSAGTGARSAGTSTSANASSATAGSAQAATTSAQGAQTGRAAASPKRARRSSAHAATPRQGAQATASGRSDLANAAASAPGSRTASASNAATRTSRHDSSAKTSSGNPLDSLGSQIPFPVPVPDWSKPIILFLLLLAIWFGARSRVAAVRARRLEGQQTALLGDLDVMQAALVPVIPARLGDVSVSVAYRPADGPAAGGDFYDLFVLEPGKVAIVLGDVAGHGRGALTQAALTRYTLRAYIQAGLEPRAALSLAGSVLAEPGELQFATVVVAIYDTVAGRLTYASAGHPAPISIGFETPESPTVCCSAPVGCNLPTGRRQTTISVPAGGKVCFFSDGLLEARTADGLLGRERLGELVAEIAPNGGAATLLERVRADALSTPDDMVACVVSSAVGTPAPARHVEELEVDRETLAAARVPVFLQACGVQAAAVAPLLVRARELVDEGGTALLRIERSDGAGAAVTALGGLSATSAKAAVGRAAEARALALR